MPSQRGEMRQEESKEAKQVEQSFSPVTYAYMYLSLW